MSKLKIKNGNQWIDIPSSGAGVPTGGSIGQVLAKSASTDYATTWVNQCISFTVTLSSSSWSSNTQTVNNIYFLASGYVYIVSPASSSFIDYGTAQICAANVTVDGQMMFSCVDTPSSNLTVNITRMVSG